MLHAPIDPDDSIRGVLDVCRNGAAIVARLNSHIIGSLGVVKAAWWYNTAVFFMSDRWLFVYPEFHHLGVGARLIAEADIVAKSASLPLIINGHQKRRGNGISFIRAMVLGTDGPKELH